MKRLGILSIMFLLMFSACRDNIDDVTITEETPIPPTLEGYIPKVLNVTASVKGFVVNENNKPVIAAAVSLNGQSTTTDDYGHFFFRDMTMNSKGTLVKIEKVGYFEGSRRFFPLQDGESYIKIELLPKSFDYTFSTQNGGTIITTEGTSIAFNPNSIKNANGTPYTGEVQVATKWLDPSNERTFEQMPGNLQGVNTSNEEVALVSYGMMAVELRGSGGEPLNIADGATATLTMPVTAAQQAEAPATIPLWSYNEQFGVWAQEGTATLQNGKYVGEVSHFSFWNCDIPIPYVQLEFQLVDENQNSLPNYAVRIKRNNGTVGYGYTDEDGKDSGLVPANESFTFEVISPLCNIVIYSQNIGPFSEDTNLGSIEVSGTAVNTLTVIGQIVNCETEPVENGLVIIKYNEQNIYYYTNDGNFEVTFNACGANSEVEITGVDLVNSLQSEATTINTNEQVSVGQIIACSAPTNYMKITVNGVSKFYPIINGNSGFPWGESSLGINTYNSSDTTSILYMLFGTDSYSNQWETEYVGFYLADSINNWRISYDNMSFTPPPSSQTFLLTVYNPFNGFGDLAEGVFSGTLLNKGFFYNINPPEEVEISGEFSFIIGN
jgi:hypothetical protein